MSQGEKICVHCGQSCAGQARVKDAKGNYAHTACAEQVKGKGTQGTPRAPAKPEQAGSMAAILADIDDADMIGGEHSCQGCGYPMDDSSMICLHCGFNRESGRQFNTKVGRDPNKPTAGGKALSMGASAGGLALAPFLPIIGACVGGAIGAVIWGLVAYGTGFEVGYLAILVGALCGIGACVAGEPETTGGGMIGGVMAAIVAVLSIGAGKYFALEMMYRKHMNGTTSSEVVDSFMPDTIDDEVLVSMFAYDIVTDMILDGEELNWLDPLMVLEVAYFPDDYPEDFQQLVYERWDGYSSIEQRAWKKHVAEKHSDLDGIPYSINDVSEEWALDEMAMTAAETIIKGGETIEWPDPTLPISSMIWPDDYPVELRQKVDAAWDELGPDGQSEFRVDAIAEIEQSRIEAQEFFEEFLGEYKKTAVIDSFFSSPIQALFLLLAIGTAYGIPANND